VTKFHGDEHKDWNRSTNALDHMPMANGVTQRITKPMQRLQFFLYVCVSLIKSMKYVLYGCET